MKPIPVVFRKWNNGDLIALFPTLPHNWEHQYCMSYAHVGQHSAASLELPNTKPATQDEYAELLRELARVGYDSLRVVKRVTASMHRERIAAIKDAYKVGA